MNRFRISTPEGTRDLLFSSCRALRQTENAVRDALEERGYSEIITPAVEYYDVFAQANPELDQDQMLKIIDKSGRICVARPDNTTPIARIAATRLDDAALPVRLYYSQKVFRSVSGDHGHKGEFLQVGAELIGADGLAADKDILSAAFAALSRTGADNFRIELGHAEIYKALIEELGADAASSEAIRRLIENKSFAALGDALQPFGSRPAAKALSAMPQLFGGIEVLDEVETLTGNVRVLGAIAYLRRLYQALDEAGYGDRIMIDLGLVHDHFDELIDAVLFLLVDAAGAQAEGDIVVDRQPREQRVFLEHEAAVGAGSGDGHAVERQLALVHLDEAGDQTQERRFAAAGRADERHERAGGDFERHIVERGDAFSGWVDKVLGDARNGDVSYHLITPFCHART